MTYRARTSPTHPLPLHPYSSATTPQLDGNHPIVLLTHHCRTLLERCCPTRVPPLELGIGASTRTWDQHCRLWRRGWRPAWRGNEPQQCRMPRLRSTPRATTRRERLWCVLEAQGSSARAPPTLGETHGRPISLPPLAPFRHCRADSLTTSLHTRSTHSRHPSPPELLGNAVLHWQQCRRGRVNVAKPLR